MSRFNDASADTGQSGDQHISSLIFAQLDSLMRPTPVSNLTKNLMSSNQMASLNRFSEPTASGLALLVPSENFAQEHQLSRDSSAFDGSVDHKFVPAGLGTHNHIDSSQAHPQSTSSLFTPNPHQGFYRPGGKLDGNANFIPLGHNAPTIVSSSYTSNYSHTPSYRSALSQYMDRSDSNNTTNPVPRMSHVAPQVQTGFLPSSYNNAPMGHGLPTTNLSMNSVNSGTSPFNHGAHRSSFSVTPQLFQSHLEPGSHSHGQVAHSLPAGSFGNRSLHPLPNRSSLATESSNPLGFNQRPNPNPSSFGQGFFTEPKPYMTYDEYLEKLNEEDAEAPPTDENGYDEHLNIVKFPVNDLITMLACLLTKIIEANDKLHPNHFDTTIAIRQKLKEEKKRKKQEKENNKQHSFDSMTYSNDGINTTVEHIDEDYANSSGEEQDDEDELKNRYLANVLAFHGTNIPGISLNAYLTRVLKYCPVTNEVFLSLLVYFDRIAKKANNLKKNQDAGGEADGEQLFVMDSYNIHRLIISGITVSSKFFSDIFYKNLRYAKVGGLPLEELNYLELQLLLLLDFKLMITVQDLQNYGDLLLKFWKREQLATDLANTAESADPGSTAANT